MNANGAVPECIVTNLVSTNLLVSAQGPVSQTRASFSFNVSTWDGPTGTFSLSNLTESVWTHFDRGYYCHKGTKYPSQNHKCPRGAYCPTGAAIPIECPEGTFNDQLGGSR